MVECGYRIRFFGEDAVVAALVLSIVAHHDHSFMVASVPTHRFLVHARRLIAAGHRVALVRQTETAAIRKGKKGSSSSTFTRDVVSVFTPGTIIDDDDPSFSDLIRHKKDSSSSKKSGRGGGGSGDEDDEDMDDDDDNTIDTKASGVDDEDDPWIAAVNESGVEISIVSVNIRANAVRLELVKLHELTRQGLQDYIDMLQVKAAK